MISGNDQPPRAAPFSPLVRAILDACAEGVVVFDNDGRYIYANARAKVVLNGLGTSESATADEIMPVLARFGSRIAPLRAGSLNLGEVVFIPGEEGPKSLADREKRAIVDTLNDTEWKLAETARVLGISRTTLWRRLRAYGLHRDKRGRWADSQTA